MRIFTSFRLSFLTAVFLLFIATSANALPPQQAPTANTPVAQQADAKQKPDVQNTGKLDTEVGAKTENVIPKNERKSPEISQWIIVSVAVLFFIVMLYLFYRFFEYVRKNDQRIGFQSIKLIGLVLMFPGICIVALVGNGLIEGNALAALFGTIAGYVLSKEDEPKNPVTEKAVSDLKTKNQALTKDMTTLKDENIGLSREISALKNEIDILKAK